MRALMMLLMFGQVLPFSHAGETNDAGKMGKMINLSSISIGDDLPDPFEIKHCPYSGSGQLVARDDVPTPIFDREASYTSYWLQKALRRDFLPGKLDRHLMAFSNIAGGDDGLGVSFRTDRYSIEILDTRVLTVLVQNRAGQRVSALSLFREVVNFDQYARHEEVKIAVIEQTDLPEGTAFGKIQVHRGRSTGWFSHPIEWFSSGDVVLFLFRKEIVPAITKVPPRDPATVVGGMPYSDERPFLRFEEANRIEIAKDYFARMQEERQQPRATENRGDSGRNPDGTVTGGVLR